MIYYEISHKEVSMSYLYGGHVNEIYIYDRNMSSEHPIAICYSIDVAEMIVSKCNKS
jgi:hypothetical protein